MAKVLDRREEDRRSRMAGRQDDADEEDDDEYGDDDGEGMDDGDHDNEGGEDMERGDGLEDDERGRARKGLETEESVELADVDRELIVDAVVEGVLKALGSRMDDIQAEQENGRSRDRKIYKALGAALEENETLRTEIRDLKKALDVPGLTEAITIMKGLGAKADEVAAATPQQRAAQPGSVQLIQKGAAIADPTAEKNGHGGGLSDESWQEAVILLNKARKIRDTHQTLIPGAKEAMEAANVGLLSERHVVNLRKGLADFESAA